MNPKVFILCATVSKPEPPVMIAMLAQGVPYIMNEALPVEGLHHEPAKNKCINIAKNRNEVRKLALTTDATHFLWMDSDVIMPKHTVEALLAHKLPAVGAWIPAKGGGWIGGRLMQPMLFAQFAAPSDGLTKTDLLSMGCTLLERSVLEQFEFEPGINQVYFTLDGRVCHLADGGNYTRRLSKAGIQAYLDGSVRCQHLCHTK